MTKVIFFNGFTGWYAKVLKEGYISKEDEIILQKRTHKNLTIAKLNKLIVNLMSDEVFVFSIYIYNIESK